MNEVALGGKRADLDVYLSVMDLELREVEDVLTQYSMWSTYPAATAILGQRLVIFNWPGFPQPQEGLTDTWCFLIHLSSHLCCFAIESVHARVIFHFCFCPKFLYSKHINMGVGLPSKECCLNNHIPCLSHIDCIIVQTTS